MASVQILEALSRRPVRAALLVVLAVLVVLPVVVSPHLLLLDAPAHEARLAVLRDLLISGRGTPFYELDTFFLPNIAFDVIGLGLTFLVSPEVAGRTFFAFTLLLTASGVVVLNRVATGRWNLVSLAAVLLLYNLVTILGFFSYIFGLALVPWALAARLKLESRAPAAGVAAGMFLSVLLLFCHVFDFGIYAVMSAGFALTAWRQGRLSLFQLMARALEPVPAALLYLLMSAGSRIPPRFDPNFLTTKLFGIVKSVTSASMAGDVAFLAGGAVFALLLFFCTRPRLAPSFVPGLIVLALLYFVLPAQMASGSYVDIRMPIAVLLMALAGLDAPLRPAKMTALLLALLGAAFLAKQAAIATLWRSYTAPVDAITAVLEGLPAGAVVMQTECLPATGDVLSIYRARQPTMQHLASLANFDGSHFVTSFYAIAGQQPVRVSRPYLPYWREQDGFDASCEHSDYRSRAQRIQRLMQSERAAGNTVPPVFFIVLRPPAPADLQPEAKLFSKGPDYALYEIAGP